MMDRSHLTLPRTSWEFWSAFERLGFDFGCRVLIPDPNAQLPDVCGAFPGTFVHIRARDRGGIREQLRRKLVYEGWECDRETPNQTEEMHSTSGSTAEKQIA